MASISDACVSTQRVALVGHPTLLPVVAHLLNADAVFYALPLRDVRRVKIHVYIVLDPLASLSEILRCLQTSVDRPTMLRFCSPGTLEEKILK